MVKKPKESDSKQLLKVLQEESLAAERHYTTGVAKEQEESLHRYLGDPLKGDDKIEGASKAISKDVAQVVDAALPDLIEPFVANEHAVEFEEDEEGDGCVVELDALVVLVEGELHFCETSEESAVDALGWFYGVLGHFV